MPLLCSLDASDVNFLNKCAETNFELLEEILPDNSEVINHNLKYKNFLNHKTTIMPER